ncbi:MAG: hypothetical protein IPM12_02280 [Flavobacteriales bacterium]|nr:hypothetical protein [Flavobacteriales bacterium]
MPKWERWFFALTLLACTVMRIAFALLDPPQLDEALNWLLFGEHGPLVALSWYAAPNNHIGHTIVSSALGLLPVDPLIALRAPGIAAAGLAQAVLFVLLRRMCGAVPVFMALAFALAAPLMLQFGHLGRGYVMVMLAFAMAFGAAAHWLRSHDARALHALVITCASAVFVMPSALYGCASLYAMLLVMSAKRWHVLRAAAWTLAGILMLHAPALIVSGPAAFLENRWVQPIGPAAVIEGWRPHVVRAFEGLMGVRYGFLVAMAMMMLAIVRSKGRKRRIAILVLGVTAVALVLPVIHGALPFERTWIFLVVPLAVAMGIVVQGAWAAKRWAWLAMAVSMILFVAQAVRLRQELPAAENEAFRAASACEALRRAAPFRIVGQSQPLSTYVLFDAKRKRYSLGISLEAAGADAPVPAGAAVIGPRRDAHALQGDRLLFADEGDDAIWIAGSGHRR